MGLPVMRSRTCAIVWSPSALDLPDWLQRYDLARDPEPVHGVDHLSQLLVGKAGLLRNSRRRGRPHDHPSRGHLLDQPRAPDLPAWPWPRDIVRPAPWAVDPKVSDIARVVPTRSAEPVSIEPPMITGWPTSR